MDNESLKSHPAKRFSQVIGIFSRHHAAAGMTPVKLREIVEELGPAFIKFGQILSMRPDIIPIEYCHELEKLRKDVLPLDFEDLKPVIETELGSPIDEIFASVDPKPLGSASVAQVHAAELKNGDRVVLKIQRPGIRQTMYEDLHLLSNHTFLIRKLLGLGDALDLKAILDVLWKTTKKELDFLHEAENIDHYRENISGLRYITCPKVYPQYCTEHIVTMSRIDGLQIDQIEQLKAEGYDLSEIAQKTAKNYCKQILDDGFFHADPHPGNLIVSDGQIAWIDWGMTGTLSPHLRAILINAVRAIWENDVFELENAFLMIGEPKKPINQARLITQLNNIVQEYRSTDFGHFDIGILFRKLIKLITDNEIVLPPDLTILSRSIVTMEGTIAKLDPDVSIMQIFSTHLRTEKLHNIDWKGGLEKHTYSLYKSMLKSIDIPAEASDLMNLSKSGKLTINIIEHSSPDTLRANRGNTRRLVYSIMMCGLFVSSALLAMSDIHPLIFGIPWPAAINMGLSLLMLIILIISIFRWNK